MPRRSRLLISLGLTFVAAGLGHLYIRQWRRGVLWLVIYVVTVVFLSAYTPVIVGDEIVRPFIFGVLEGEFQPAGAVLPLTILTLALIDVYLLQRFDRSDDEQ